MAEAARETEEAAEDRLRLRPTPRVTPGTGEVAAEKDISEQSTPFVVSRALPLLSFLRQFQRKFPFKIL